MEESLQVVHGQPVYSGRPWEKLSLLEKKDRVLAARRLGIATHVTAKLLGIKLDARRTTINLHGFIDRHRLTTPGKKYAPSIRTLSKESLMTQTASERIIFEPKADAPIRRTYAAPEHNAGSVLRYIFKAQMARLK